LGVLRLLSGCATGNAEELLKRCLQGEEISLDVQGVRGRILHIRKAGLAVRDGDEMAADICTRWLICMFSFIPYALATYYFVPSTT
jgi:U3 small nucleolar RNA-associated protein 20